MQQNKEDNIQEGKESVINTSSLSSLLQWDGTIDVKEYMNFPPLGGGRPPLEVKVRALSTDDMDSYRDMSTMTGRNRATGATIKEIDDDKLQAITIFNAVTSPDLSNEALQTKLNSGNTRAPYLIVNKLFLPGEQREIVNKIYRLSGFKSEDQIEGRETSEVDLY